MKRDTKVLKALGVYVRQRREALGMSQEDLAGLAELHRNYIGGIERGDRDPGLTALIELARGLGLSASALIGAVQSAADNEA